MVGKDHFVIKITSFIHILTLISSPTVYHFIKLFFPWTICKFAY